MLRQFLRYICPKCIGENSSGSSGGVGDTYILGSRECPDPHSLEPEADSTTRDLETSGSPNGEMASDKRTTQRTSDGNSELEFAAMSYV